MASANRCRGVRSIQLEISRRIRSEHGQSWAKPMRDKDIRDFYRHEIIGENDGEWCDFIARTCVCNKPASVIKSSGSWDDVFPGSLQTLKGDA